MGKWQAEKTHCKHGHGFTEENTYVSPTNGSRSCRVCLRAAARRRSRTHPEKKARSHNRYYEANRAKLLAYTRERSLRLLGITTEGYDSMLKAQNYSCAICGKSSEQSTKRFAVDHDHATGEVRGLLCSNCNSGLGMFKDNEKILGSAIQYLSFSHPSNIWAFNPKDPTDTGDIC